MCMNEDLFSPDSNFLEVRAFKEKPDLISVVIVKVSIKDYDGA